MTARLLDLFAGPGGWDEGLKALGRTDVLGIDYDRAACETAEAAGHARMYADIAALDPGDIAGDIEGLLASPPCPGFSRAGKGLGRQDFELLVNAVGQLAHGADPWCVLDGVRRAQNDERSALTLEPLRWAMDLEPDWVAFEQVPTVLPLWEAYADLLRLDGYDVWTGILHAERYGVPQTRRRAILLAHRGRWMHMPHPTHSRYHAHAPERLDPDVHPWVSMADALAWGLTRRPSYTVTGAGIGSGGPEVFSNGSRQGMRTAMVAGHWTPEPAIPGERAEDIVWPYMRPSPTIVGSFAPDVVAAPGYRRPGDPPRQKTPGSVRIGVRDAATLQTFPRDYPWSGGPKSSIGKKFQQVGNAVPPLLAAHVLAVPLAVTIDPEGE